MSKICKTFSPFIEKKVGIYCLLPRGNSREVQSRPLCLQGLGNSSRSQRRPSTPKSPTEGHGSISSTQGLRRSHCEAGSNVYHRLHTLSENKGSSADLEYTEEKVTEMVKHFGKEVPPHPNVWRKVGYCETDCLHKLHLIYTEEQYVHHAPTLTYPSPSNQRVICDDDSTKNGGKDGEALETMISRREGLVGD